MSSRWAHCFQIVLAVAAAALIIYAAPANAALMELDDGQLARVVGQDGLHDKPALRLLPALLDALHFEGTAIEKDARADFDSFLSALGIARLPSSFYDGQAVSHIFLNAAPADIHEDASNMLRALGVNYDSPALGSITVKQIDMRGTNLWSWPH